MNTSSWKAFSKTAKLGAFLTATYAFTCDYENKNILTHKNWACKLGETNPLVKLNKMMFSSFGVNCQALTQNQRKNLMEKETDVYVWGNGEQVDMSLDYSNFYPKKIKNFSEKDSPQIIIVRFGEFHEAYLDKTGKIHICSKHRLPSMKLKEVDDCYRADMKLLEIKGRKIQDMVFTQNRLFALTDRKEVYVWKINYEVPETGTDEDIFSQDVKDFVISMSAEAIHIPELKNITEIKSGTDHFLALDTSGDVWAMGDDTFGQCGHKAGFRPETPPFKERRYGKPVRVMLPSKVHKIASGFRHCFAITEGGELYGWGYNNQQQLSHSEEFAHETNAKHVMFEPVKITREMDGRRAIDVNAGKDFSIIVTKDRKDVQEVFSTGNNLRGQLGINRISHLQDIMRIDDISGFVDSDRQTPLNIAHVACGRRHAMVVFDYGAFFIWGDNEKGQIGDRTRRMIESPFPKAKFELKHNVLNVEAGYDNCAVIVERLPEKIRDKDDEDEKRKKKKSKRQAKQLQTTPRPVIKEPEQPSLFKRMKDKVQRILRRRQMEMDKMRAIQQEQQKKETKKTDEQLIYEEVTKETGGADEKKPAKGKEEK